jgi:L-ribulose-5-phosphate 3-epimerase
VVNVSDIRSNIIGLYEKALPAYLSWEERLSLAKYAGYDFLEISIDESDDRMGRLDWSYEQKLDIKSAMMKTEMPVLTMCLSGNRRFPIGSKISDVREKGIALIKKAILFSIDIGIRVIQLAGYDEYYNESDDVTAQNFFNAILECTDYAAQYDVMLAFETMDTDHLDSIKKAMYYINKVKSPWLNIYPDIGNLSSRKVDIRSDFYAGQDHIVAIHLKDTRENEFRRVEFGEGIVDFVGFFKLLDELQYKGPFVVEMWSDDGLDSIPDAKKAKEFLIEKMNIALASESEKDKKEKKDITQGGFSSLDV